MLVSAAFVSMFAVRVIMLSVRVLVSMFAVRMIMLSMRVLVSALGMTAKTV
jgi:hypothetical protein